MNSLTILRLWWLTLALALACLSGCDVSNVSGEPKQHGQQPRGERRVVVVVMDGLRPDSVTAKKMPTLHAMAQRGTFFARHHAAFISSTEVNGTALATGCHPETSGIIANKEYRPDINHKQPIATEHEADVRKGDELTHGHYLAVPTAAEALRAAKHRTAIAGTKGVALLLDRSADRGSGDESVVIFKGKTIAAAPEVGTPPFPPVADSTRAANAAQDQWTTDRLLSYIAKGDMPIYSVLWLSEPDFAQHGAGPGSAVALAALKSSDDCLARVLRALDERGLRDRTNVMVVSDHGFSTISRAVDVTEMLRKAGFAVFSELAATPQPGDILVVGNGGAVSLYVVGHDAATIQRLVDFLQRSDFAGVIFTRQPLVGTFALTQARLASAEAPDVLFSMAWSDARNSAGIPGSLVSEGKKRGPGQGNHASLSPFDMHNTLIAAGPDFRPGLVSELPSGNIDVAPTIMTLLGFPELAEKMEGRILAESFVNSGRPAPVPVIKTETAERRLVDSTWRQSLQLTQVGKALYVDQGTAALVNHNR